MNVEKRQVNANTAESKQLTLAPTTSVVAVMSASGGPLTNPAEGAGSRGHGVGLAAIAFSSLLLLLTLDAFLHPRAFLDLSLTRAVQQIDLPYLQRLLRPVDWLTSSEGGIAAWGMAAVLFLLLRWWLPALAVMVFPPLAGLANGTLNGLVQRERPTADHLQRVIGGTDAPSFPSGHVVGAVAIYGLLYLIAGRIPSRLLRLTVRVACVVIVVVVGPARVWYGAHWPSDVLAGYALGGLCLAGMIAVYRRLDPDVGRLPLVRALAPPHDEAVPHAHALTSLVLFEGPTVEKIYAPGFVPRMLYWFSFQAEFPYLRNRAALCAALHRRNLAALLTEYWYGTPRVAHVLAAEPVGAGYALRGEFVAGGAPRDRLAAKAWLRELRAHFEQAGLPTWQIDPRQPRAVDNVLETPDGRYMIVDLESGLVAPIASLTTWRRAIRRGLVPIYDDVYFDVTRAYIARERAAIAAALGETRTADLLTTLDAAEAATLAWHKGEPRVWGRLVGGIWTGYDLQHLPAHARRGLDAGRERAAAWIGDAIDRWRADGRLSADEGDELRQRLASSDVQDVLPHLGAHLGITLVLRFPFGSLGRFAWTLGNLTATSALLLGRRTDRRAWRLAWQVHSPLVMVWSLLPTVGGFAYLLARPVRRNPLLLRVTADAVLLKLPWRLYERTGLRRLIARPVGPGLSDSEQRERAVQRLPRFGASGGPSHAATAEIAPLSVRGGGDGA